MEESNYTLRDMFTNPRIHARTAYLLTNGEDSEVQDDMTTEHILDKIHEGINQQIGYLQEYFEGMEVPEELMYVQLNIPDNIKKSIRVEVADRLRDYGYQVLLVADDEEEVNLLNEVGRMAEDGDVTMMEALNDLIDNTNSLHIAWGNFKLQDGEN